jgi:2'-5' RNA ligase
MKLIQKYALITLIEPADEGTKFSMKNFPRHVTLAGVFAVDTDSSGIYSGLVALLDGQKPFVVEAKQQLHWGTDGELLVMKLKSSPKIIELHNKIDKKLADMAAVFNEPEYQGSGWIPHSTAQKTTKLSVGDKVNIDSVTIVDMFPDSDGYQRKILQTVYLRGR